MEPARGTLINPRIRLVEELGRGAMGSVWRAEHLTLDTEVAVKLIARDAVQDEREALERFTREAKAAARIKSHHVVQTLDHGVADGGAPYIVLELLEGESLEDMLRRGSLSPSSTATVVTHVTRALSSAHSVGILHRDIKPANIFCTHVADEPCFKVLDFGVAKLQKERRSRPPAGAHPEVEHRGARQLTLAGTLIGTPEYMSPARMSADGSGSPLDDLWALAVVAYRSLTGELPFQGEDFDTLSLSVIRARHVPPSELVPELSPDVDAWFARALAPRTGDRFGTAAELSASFERLVLPVQQAERGGSTASEGLPAPSSGGPRFGRRARWLGGLALGVLAVAVWATFQLGDERGMRIAAPANQPRAGAPASRASSLGGSDTTAPEPASPAGSSASAPSAPAQDLGKRIATDGRATQSSGAGQRVSPSPQPSASASTSHSASPPPELPERELGF